MSALRHIHIVFINKIKGNQTIGCISRRTTTKQSGLGNDILHIQTNLFLTDAYLSVIIQHISGISLSIRIMSCPG